MSRYTFPHIGRSRRRIRRGEGHETLKLHTWGPERGWRVLFLEADRFSSERDNILTGRSFFGVNLKRTLVRESLVPLGCERDRMSLASWRNRATDSMSWSSIAIFGQ